MERIIKTIKWATHPKHSHVKISNNGLVMINGVLLTRVLSYANGHLYFIVDEIIDVLGGAGVYSFADPKTYEYWEEVKLEIEKL